MMDLQRIVSVNNPSVISRLYSRRAGGVETNTFSYRLEKLKPVEGCQRFASDCPFMLRLWALLGVLVYGGSVSASSAGRRR
jgi:hypothetical protein